MGGSVDQEEIGGGSMIEKEIDHDRIWEYSQEGLQLNSDGELDHEGGFGGLSGRSSKGGENLGEREQVSRIIVCVGLLSFVHFCLCIDVCVLFLFYFNIQAR